MPRQKLYAIVVNVSPVLRYLQFMKCLHFCSIVEWNPNNFKCLCYICGQDLCDNSKWMYDMHMKYCLSYGQHASAAYKKFGNFVSLLIRDSEKGPHSFECLKCVWDKKEGKVDTIYASINYDCIIQHFAGQHAHKMSKKQDN